MRFFAGMPGFCFSPPPPDDLAADLSSDAVLLRLCVCGFVCGVCFCFVCSSSLVLLVPRKGCLVIVAFFEYYHLYLSKNINAKF